MKRKGIITSLLVMTMTGALLADVEEKHQILEKQKKKKVQRKQSQQNLKKQILS